MKLNALAIGILVASTSVAGFKFSPSPEGGQIILGGGSPNEHSQEKQDNMIRIVQTITTTITAAVPSRLPTGLRTITTTLTRSRGGLNHRLKANNEGGENAPSVTPTPIASLMPAATSTSSSGFWDWLRHWESPKRGGKEVGTPRVRVPGCFCAAGSLCCHGEDMELSCSYGVCGV